jgi:hypothetical protein
MPNHVECDMTIRGPRAFLDAFAAKAKHKDAAIAAEPFIPYPDEFRIPDEARAAAMERHRRGEISLTEAFAVPDGFNAGGYEWCRANWGTKWGIYDAVQRPRANKGTTLRYSFQSAWTPPLPVFHAMSAQFPMLHFTVRYYERGMGFQGLFVIKAGA